jgi:hypothetical protein
MIVGIEYTGEDGLESGNRSGKQKLVVELAFLFLVFFRRRKTSTKITQKLRCCIWMRRSAMYSSGNIRQSAGSEDGRITIKGVTTQQKGRWFSSRRQNDTASLEGCSNLHSRSLLERNLSCR